MDDAPADLNFNSVLWRTQARVRAYIAGMGAAAHEVDDLAQEVYLELYRNFDQMPVEVAPEQWLKGIARNVCLNHFRKSARRGRLHREALAEILAGTLAQTEQLMTSGSVGIALEECVAKLPAEQQQLVEMRYQQDLTSAMIAERLKSTADAVRMTLYRVRTALKTCVTRTLAGQR
jgi:RNA polymerase sigma-70 factor (ECF subfamily)